MTATNRFTSALATVGVASLICFGVCIVKLVLALTYQSDAPFFPAPPRDAFSGRVFWITGASSGIGRALALHLCSNYDNLKLILSSRREVPLEEVAAKCRERGVANEAKVLTLDLAELPILPSMVDEAMSLYGGVDVLVNNGGVTTRSMAQSTEFEVDVYLAKVGFLSYVSLTKALLPSWKQPDSHKHARISNPIIINTSSVAAKFGVPVRTAYCAAKHAIMGWFDSFRIEQFLLGQPVDVLNVVLGSTKTDVARNAIAGSVNTKLEASDINIDGGLDPEFVVGRILAAVYAGRQELWIAPMREMLALYLNQYVPETARKVMMKFTAKQYAIETIVNQEMTDTEL
eukprot:CCRYP_001618-RA/>CCRYP_001618-RA protein AED:0.05 eAED:0.04 QI:0/0/0/1/1/1/2/0/344